MGGVESKDTASEISVLVDTLGKVVESWKESGGDPKAYALQRQAIERIRKDQRASFKYVDKNHVSQVRNGLASEGIPYVEVPSSEGSAFVVAISEEGAFLSAQASVMFDKLEFARYCTSENILRSAAEMGYNDVIRMSFSNPLSCKVALQELYKSKIPSAVVKKGGELLLFIHPEYLYRNGESDFSDFRLKMAMYEAGTAALFGGRKSPLMATKLRQVKYDDEQLDKFAEAVKDNKPVVYGDAFAKSSCYLESKSGNIVVNERSAGGWSKRTIQLDSAVTTQEIKKVCMSYLSVIRNGAVVPRKLWNAKFRDGSPDKTDEAVTSVMRERPKYSQESKPFYKLQSTKLQAVLDAVSKEAGERTEKKVGLVSVTDAQAMKDAYGLKSEEIAELLEEGTLPEIEDFLSDEEEALSEKQKLQWLMELLNAYDGTKSDPVLSYSHKIVSHEAARSEMQKSVSKEMDDKVEVKD